MSQKDKHSILAKIDPIPLILLLVGICFIAYSNAKSWLFAIGWIFVVTSIGWYVASYIKKRQSSQNADIVTKNQEPNQLASNPFATDPGPQVQTGPNQQKAWSKTKKILVFIVLFALGYLIWPIVLWRSFAPTMTIDIIRGRGIFGAFTNFYYLFTEDLLAYLAFCFIFAFFTAMLLYGFIMRSSGQWPRSSGQYKPDKTTTKQMVIGLLIIFACIGVILPIALGFLYYYLAHNK